MHEDKWEEDIDLETREAMRSLEGEKVVVERAFEMNGIRLICGMLGVVLQTFVRADPGGCKLWASIALDDVRTMAPWFSRVGFSGKRPTFEHHLFAAVKFLDPASKAALLSVELEKLMASFGVNTKDVDLERLQKRLQYELEGGDLKPVPDLEKNA